MRAMAFREAPDAEIRAQGALLQLPFAVMAHSCMLRPGRQLLQNLQYGFGWTADGGFAVGQHNGTFDQDRVIGHGLE